MKRIYYKASFFLLMMLVTAFIGKAQEIQMEYVFKIHVPLNSIKHNKEPDSLDIDYLNKTTNLNNESQGLFYFRNVNESSWGRLSLYYNKRKGQIFLDFLPDGNQIAKRNLYNLFYTRAKLHDGDNVLKLAIRENQIWVTCNSGTTEAHLIEGSDKGEGVLWENKMDLYKAKSNLVMFSNVDTLSVRSVTVTRHLSESYLDDPVYDEYGYSDEDLTQPMQMGNGLHFDGSNDYVSVPASSSFSFGTGNFSLQAWVKCTPSNDIRIAIGRFNGSGNDYWLGSNNNKAAFSISGLTITGSKTISDGNWHHITGVRSGGVLSLYVDGVPDAANIANTRLANPSGPLYIGAFNTGYNFPGVIDEVRIWNTALSEEDIQQTMNVKHNGIETGLVAYYDFDHGSTCSANPGVSSLVDLTGHNHNGTLQNFALTGATSNWVPGVSPPTEKGICIGAMANLMHPVSGGVWSSANTNIATVSSEGQVTGIAPGTVNINYTIPGPGGCATVSTAVITVNALPGTPGITGNGLHFDGSNDYVNVNATLGNFGTGDFTAEVNFRTTATTTFLISKRAVCSHGNFWNLLVDPNGKFMAELDESSTGTNYTTLRSTQSVNDGQWHHAAVVRSNGVLKLYIDGVLSSSVPCITNLNNTNLFRLGYICAANQNFKGTMDEVRIWNVARTEAELLANRNTELAGNEPGLMAYYNFNTGQAAGTNTGSNTLTDKSGKGNTGTLTNFALTGATSNWVAGSGATLKAALSNGMSFDGFNDYVTVITGNNFPMGNSSYTLEAWIKPNNHTAAGIIGWGDPATGNITTLQGTANLLKLGANSTIINSWSNGELMVTSANLADGKWHHIAATYDGTNRKIYVDGAVAGQDNPGDNNVTNKANITIGRTDNNDYFNGNMDEVRVWNIARTESQIRSSMYAELGGTETGLAAYYNFNQGVADSINTGIKFITDKTEGLNSGRLNNFVLTEPVSNFTLGSINTFGPTVCIGGTFQLNNAAADGEWYSLNPDIATVTANGVVSGIAPGTASLLYTATNPSGCSASSEIDVTVTSTVLPTSIAGNGLNFDGVNDYVRINNSVTASFTLELNIKTAVPSLFGQLAYHGNGLIWSDVAGSANDFSLAVLNNKIAFFDGSNARSLNSDRVVTDGAWHHIALTRQASGVMTLYIDGVLEDAATAGAAALTANPFISIGGNTLDSRYFNGAIDEVRIWNTVRTQAQIKSAMFKDLSGGEAGLVDYYNFNQGIAAGSNTGLVTATDTRGSTNHGTLNNFALTGASSNWVAGIAATAIPILCPNGTMQLNNATIGGAWSTANPAVATVSNTGLVTAVGSGIATISYAVMTGTGCNMTTTATISVNHFQPTGAVDGYAPGTVSSNTTNVITGWTFDKDEPGRSLLVHVYVSSGPGNNTILGAITANDSRPDVNAAQNITGNHGFHYTIPAAYLDGNEYTFNFYAINVPDFCGNPRIGSASFRYCPAAKPVITPASASTCNGSATTLSTPALTGATYKWATTPNGTSIGTQATLTVSPSVTTKYFVTVTNSAGCAATSDSALVQVVGNTMVAIPNSTGVMQIMAGLSGRTYAIFNDDRLYLWNGTNWSRISNSIYASSIAVQSNGNLWWVADGQYPSVFFITCNASGIPVNMSTEFLQSSALKVATGANNTVAIIGTDNAVWKWNGNGSTNNGNGGMITGGNAASFVRYANTDAGDIAVDASGRIWYTDRTNYSIKYLNTSNQWVTISGYTGKHVACGADGSVYITGSVGNAIYKWNGSTAFNVVSELGTANTDLAVHTANSIVKMDNGATYKTDCVINTTGSKGAVSNGHTESSITPVVRHTKLLVYPNPNDGMFRVSLTLTNSTPVMFRLVDIQGRVVHQEMSAAVAGSQVYDLAPKNLSSGIYFLKVDAEGFTETVKISIER